MAQVELFKKQGTYLKNGEEKSCTNFYLRCGESLIPIQICFFANEEGKDPQYGGRREVMKAFAAILPDPSSKGAERNVSKPTPSSSSDDDSDDIPF